MALLDQLHRMEQEVARRLRELEPLVREHGELQEVARRLGIAKPDGTSARSTSGASRGRRASGGRAALGSTASARKPERSAARRASTPRKGRRRKAAAPGSRQEDVLRIVYERPGISVPELGKELGVDPTGLYQIVRRLEGRGVIRKEGRELRPVAATPAAAAGTESTTPGP
jgi:hypothetical protein